MSASLQQQLEDAAGYAAQALSTLQRTPDALGNYEEPRKRLLGGRPARIVRAGEGWRLGVLVVSTDGLLFHGGETLRAHEPPAVKGYTSESARWRDELRSYAVKGGFAEGETVHWGLQAINLAELTASSSPIAVRDGALVVRWAPRAPVATAPTL